MNQPTNRPRASAVIAGFILTASAIAAACGGAVSTEPAEGMPAASNKTAQALTAAEAHGKEIWFKNTYGGGWFLTTFLGAAAPPDKRLKLGFDVLLATPRAERFAKFGVINDPDCHAPQAGDTIDPLHPNDVCADPEATGVLGLRLEHDYDLATGVKNPAKPLQFGVACAACHAGFDPVNVPADPAEPKWENIHPTIGSLRFRFGAVFGAHLDATNPAEAPKKAIFDSWNAGTVDTTTLFDDGLNNPGVVTAFFDVPARPYFTNSSGTFHRGGQGGEDDVGGQTAAARVYSNVGMCYRECSLPAVMGGVPISVAACKQTCRAWPPDQDLDDMVAFLNSVPSPKNPHAKSASNPVVQRGKAVFDATCASCHSGEVASSDVVLPLGSETSGANIETNNCRALTTNWDNGKIWQDFGSAELRSRGFKGYRVMPLNGMWATAPYLHHNGVGTIDLGTVSVGQENADFASSMRELLTPPAQRTGTRVKTTTLATPSGPVEIPVNVLPSLKGGRACDTDELRGHSFGTDLAQPDKVALIEYLRTL